MPTGYTSNIKDGINFNKFIMDCARAFGACVTMKEDSKDTRIPKEFEVSTYHEEEIKKTLKETETINNMTVQEARKRATEDRIKEKKYNNKCLSEAVSLRKKYDNMLRKAKQWTPPSKDHVGLKNFMIDQIEESIRWDCNLDYYIGKKIKLITGLQWLKNKITKLEGDLYYHIQAKKEERDRVDRRNKWVKDLRESLKV